MVIRQRNHGLIRPIQAIIRLLMGAAYPTEHTPWALSAAEAQQHRIRSAWQLMPNGSPPWRLMSPVGMWQRHSNGLLIPMAIRTLMRTFPMSFPTPGARLGPGVHQIITR